MLKLMVERTVPFLMRGCGGPSAYDVVIVWAARYTVVMAEKV